MTNVRCEAYFSGRVQGVGFRVTCRQIANDYDVVGYVRNLPDGRVHLVVEASEPEIRRFVAEIRRVMGACVHGFSEDKLAANGEFDKFVIRS